MSANITNGRTRTGSVMFEFLCISWFLVVVALLSTNLGLVVYCAWTNDAACRDATRAAAQQTTATSARQAAQGAIARFASGSYWLSSPRLDLSGDSFAYEAFADSQGQPQRQKNPYVRVSTSTVVRLPAPIAIVGCSLADTVTLKQSYTFPIVTLPSGKP